MWHTCFHSPKGQLINLKRTFCYLQFFQKMNENNSILGIIQCCRKVKKTGLVGIGLTDQPYPFRHHCIVLLGWFFLVFCSFFGKIEDAKKSFRNCFAFILSLFCFLYFSILSTIYRFQRKLPEIVILAFSGFLWKK